MERCKIEKQCVANYSPSYLQASGTRHSVPSFPKGLPEGDLRPQLAMLWDIQNFT